MPSSVPQPLYRSGNLFLNDGVSARGEDIVGSRALNKPRGFRLSQVDRSNESRSFAESRSGAEPGRHPGEACDWRRGPQSKESGLPGFISSRGHQLLAPSRVPIWNTNAIGKGITHSIGFKDCPARRAAWVCNLPASTGRINGDGRENSTIQTRRLETTSGSQVTYNDTTAKRRYVSVSSSSAFEGHRKHGHQQLANLMQGSCSCGQAPAWRSDMRSAFPPRAYHEPHER